MDRDVEAWTADKQHSGFALTCPFDVCLKHHPTSKSPVSPGTSLDNDSPIATCMRSGSLVADSCIPLRLNAHWLALCLHWTRERPIEIWSTARRGSPSGASGLAGRCFWCLLVSCEGRLAHGRNSFGFAPRPDFQSLPTLNVSAENTHDSCPAKGEQLSVLFTVNHWVCC